MITKTRPWGSRVHIGVGLALLWGSSHCGELRVIELADGSVIVGQVLSAHDGIYTVQTTAFGTVTLKDADIVAIRFKEAAAPVPHDGSAPPLSSQPDAHTVQALQKQILSDPTIANSLNMLKDDPELQQVLKDPDIMKAIQNGDLGQLKSNPKIQNLIANPEIQSILKNFQP